MSPNCVGGPGATHASSRVFSEVVVINCGSIELWKADVVELAYTRGVGVGVACRCSAENRLTHVWVDDHTRVRLLDVASIAVVDLWEPASMLDIKSSQRGEYINVLLDNVNWAVVEQRCA